MTMRRRPVWRRSVRGSIRISLVMLLGLPIFVASAGAVGFGALVYGNLAGTIPEQKPGRRLEPSHVYLMNPDGTRGEEIASFREFEVALPMKREDIPPVLKAAVIASEDRQFWTHKGVDPFGIGRAAYVDLVQGGARQGGSTITQQLVREKFLTREQTIERKFNEVLLATRYERDLVDQVKRETGMDDEAAEREAKERILFDYLDVIYFGAGAYGAQAASQVYFRKDVKDLTMSEAAVLVSTIPSPTRYSPRENVNLAEERRKLVLRSMLDAKVISQAEYDDAVNQFIWVSMFGPPPRTQPVLMPPPRNEATKYPYFVDYIRRYLTDKYGADELYHGGMDIYAAIDPRMQAAAEASVADTLSGTEWPLEMSLVSLDPKTGQVKALVGGRDYNHSQVNLALGGSLGFGPGSSFKAFVAGRAIEERIPPDRRIQVSDAYQPRDCKRADCVIENAAAGEGGPRSMLDGTEMSINTFYVRLIEEVGPQEVAEFARRVGVTALKPGEQQYDYQLAVGRYEVSPLDMASGYGTFANRGVYATPTPVAKAVRHSTGDVLEDNTKPKGTQVIEPEVADMVNEVYRKPIEGGSGTARGVVKLDRVAAGKTGTLEGYKAAWFVGHVPQLATAVWMGHMDAPRPLTSVKGQSPVYGGGWPAMTWNAYMNEALKGMPVEDFVPPPKELAPLEGGAAPAPGTPLPPGAPPIVYEDVRKPSSGGPRIDEIPADCGGPCVATGGGSRSAPTTPATVPPTTATTAAPTTTKPSTTSSQRRGTP